MYMGIGPCNYISTKLRNTKACFRTAPSWFPYTARGEYLTSLEWAYRQKEYHARRTSAHSAHGKATAGGPCVDVAWLKRNLEDVRILDARGQTAPADCEPLMPQHCTADYDAYLKGHIPGAVFFSWVRDGVRWRLRNPPSEPQADEYGSQQGRTASPDGGPQPHHPAPMVLAVEGEVEMAVACLEARGLSAEQTVVVYDDGTSMTAARVWWLLMLYGHPAPYILHGGWRAWRDAGGGSELYEPCPLKLSSVFDAPAQPAYRATAEEFRSAAAVPPSSAAGRGAHGAAAHGGGGGGVDSASGSLGVIAVLLVPEGYHGAMPPGATFTPTTPPDHTRPEVYPAARRVTLSDLTGRGQGEGQDLQGPAAPGGMAAWSAGAVAAGGEGPGGGLAARLSAVLGVEIGGGGGGDMGVRMLLASPHDASLSACVAAVLLHAAGHRRWAVCEEL